MQIILTTCNARFSHTALSLRLLRANLGELKENSEIIEFNLKSDVYDAAVELLSRHPSIVGISVYIWNVDFCRQLVEILRNVDPGLYIVLGGPEIADVEHYADDPLLKLASCLIIGEGENAFRDVCEKVLAGNPVDKIIRATPCDPLSIILPYNEYSDEDIQHRIVYLETSRGCPYRCAFCLSAKDKPLRFFDLDTILREIDALYQRGVRSFKFLDRTLNASLPRALLILRHFERYIAPDLSLHFEMVPHEIPEELLDELAKFPSPIIQIEFGVQTLNPSVARLIHRPLNPERLLENLRILESRTHTHVHADLIAGLPDENLESFAEGFNRLHQTGVQEIQLGILKRLKSSPLTEKEKEWGLVFAPYAPYEILKTPALSFEELTSIKRFAKYWDTIVNNGNFPETSALILNHGDANCFANFMQFSEWIFAQTNTTTAISLTRWVALLFQFLTEKMNENPECAAMTILRDYLHARKEDIPPILRPYIPADFKISSVCQRMSNRSDKAHQRQQKHIQ